MDNIEDIELLNSEEAFDRELLPEQENDFEIQLEKDENPPTENNDLRRKEGLKVNCVKYMVPQKCPHFWGEGGAAE